MPSTADQPHATQLTLKRFLLVMAMVALPLGVVLTVSLAPRATNDEDRSSAIFVSIGLSLFGGFMVAGMRYLFFLGKNMHRLHMTENDLLLGEIVLQETRGSMVHYRTGRSWRFWEADGGRLFLTNGYLIFKTHGGQPTQYTLAIPLTEVAAVHPCNILSIFPGGLRVETTDGQSELFTFGAVGSNNATRWASDLLAVRDQLSGYEGDRHYPPRGP